MQFHTTYCAHSFDYSTMVFQAQMDYLDSIRTGVTVMLGRTVSE